MPCSKCNDTGIKKSGEVCEYCDSYLRNQKKIIKTQCIPEKYTEASFQFINPNQMAQAFIDNYSTNTNYIIQGQNSTGKITLVVTLIRKLLKEGRKVLPIFSLVNLESLISVITKGSTFEYKQDIVIDKEDIDLSDIMCFRINTPLTSSESILLQKLVEYRELQSKNIVITTQSPQESLFKFIEGTIIKC